MCEKWYHEVRVTPRGEVVCEDDLLFSLVRAGPPSRLGDNGVQRIAKRVDSPRHTALKVADLKAPFWLPVFPTPPQR